MSHSSKSLPRSPRRLGSVVSAIATALALVAASCGGTPADEPAPSTEIGDGYSGTDAPMYDALDIPAGSPRVVVLGDSVAAGLHLDPAQAWPAALQRQLFERGLPFELANAGVSGDTTTGGLARLAWQLKSEPDVVVIELGANNGLRGVSLERTEADLREIVEGVRAAGAVPVLIGMNVPTNLGQYAVDFADIYRRIAEDMDVAFVNRFLEGVGGVPDMNLPDGLHPTPEGHERLAANVADTLAEVLRGLKSAPVSDPD